MTPKQEKEQKDKKLATAIVMGEVSQYAKTSAYLNKITDMELATILQDISNLL